MQVTIQQEIQQAQVSFLNSFQVQRQILDDYCQCFNKCNFTIFGDYFVQYFKISFIYNRYIRMQLNSLHISFTFPA